MLFDSIRFDSIRFVFYSIRFCSILFDSMLFDSILFYSIRFYSEAKDNFILIPRLVWTSQWGVWVRSSMLHCGVFVICMIVSWLNDLMYTHNWSLQPCSQDYDIASHTTYIVCFNFIHLWQDLQFKFDSERQTFGKLVMAILFTLRGFARNPLRESRRRNMISYIVLL